MDTQLNQQVKTLNVYVSTNKNDCRNEHKNMVDHLSKLLEGKYKIQCIFNIIHTIDIVLVAPRFIGIDNTVKEISDKYPKALCILFDIDNAGLTQFNENNLKKYFGNSRFVKFSDIQNDPNKLVLPKQQDTVWNLSAAAKVAQDLENKFEQGYYPQEFLKYLDQKHYIFLNKPLAIMFFCILFVAIFQIAITIHLQQESKNNLHNLAQEVERGHSIVPFICPSIIALLVLIPLCAKLHSNDGYERSIFGRFIMSKGNENTIDNLPFQNYSDDYFDDYVNLNLYKMRVVLDNELEIEIYLDNTRNYSRKLFYKGQIRNNKFYKGDFYDISTNNGKILYTI